MDVLVIVIIVLIAGCGIAAALLMKKNKGNAEETPAQQNQDSATTVFVRNDVSDGNTQVLLTNTNFPVITLVDCTDENRVINFAVDSEVIMGRNNEASVIVDNDNSISKKHCSVSFTNGKIMVKDLASANKTYINNIEITAPSELRSGDVLRLGRTSFDVSIVFPGR